LAHAPDGGLPLIGHLSPGWSLHAAQLGDQNLAAIECKQLGSLQRPQVKQEGNSGKNQEGG
jgi:hypothetical protein